MDGKPGHDARYFGGIALENLVAMLGLLVGGLFVLYLGLACTYMMVVLVREVRKAVRTSESKEEDEYDDELDEETDPSPKRKPSPRIA